MDPAPSQVPSKCQCMHNACTSYTHRWASTKVSTTFGQSLMASCIRPFTTNYGTQRSITHGVRGGGTLLHSTTERIAVHNNTCGSRNNRVQQTTEQLATERNMCGDVPVAQRQRPGCCVSPRRVSPSPPSPSPQTRASQWMHAFVEGVAARLVVHKCYGMDAATATGHWLPAATKLAPCIDREVASWVAAPAC